ncbi:MAG: hypothetical protein ACK5X3_15345, partial [Pseudomonadota bacterium]
MGSAEEGLVLDDGPLAAQHNRKRLGLASSAGSTNAARAHDGPERRQEHCRRQSDYVDQGRHTRAPTNRSFWQRPCAMRTPEGRQPVPHLSVSEARLDSRP